MSRCSVCDRPFCKILIFYAQKGIDKFNHSKNSTIIIKMHFNLIKTKRVSKNKLSQALQFFTLFQIKKSIWHYVVLWSNFAGDASSNAPSEKNAKQVFEIPYIAKIITYFANISAQTSDQILIFFS